MAGRPHNDNLATAKLVGDKTYEGSIHAICGTTTRYTSGGGCVKCARDKQTEMRDALAETKRSREVAEQFLTVAVDERLTEIASGPKDPWE